MFEFLPKDNTSPEITAQDCQNAAELFDEVMPSFFERLSRYVQREDGNQILYLEKQEGGVNIGIALVATGHAASCLYTASFRVAIDGSEESMSTYEAGDNSELYKIRDFPAGEIINDLVSRGLLTEAQCSAMSEEELSGFIEGYRAREATVKGHHRVGTQEIQNFLWFAVTAAPRVAF